jgi:hypothetical protein
VRKRRTRITIETDETVVARHVVSPVVAWCPKCETEASMLTAQQAALSCQVDQNRIHEWIQSGALHAWEIPENGLLICFISLDQQRR